MEAVCAGCVYGAQLGGMWICDYLGKTGRRRPCPGGEGCAVREKTVEQKPKKGAWSMSRRSWDAEQARALHGAGKSDAEIAEAVGATPGAVGFWRRQEGLPANRRAEASAKAPVSAPQAGGSPSGPVALSLELDGCTVALSAPDVEKAVRACGYVRRLLAELEAGSGL